MKGGGERGGEGEAMRRLKGEGRRENGSVSAQTFRWAARRS
jgi:hypothetical protein